MTELSHFFRDSRISFSSKNHLNTYFIEGYIKKTTATICVAKSEFGTKFALKLYPFIETRISMSYLNESRFTFLQHENIISLHDYVSKFQALDQSGKSTNCSIVVMELARCDLFDLVKTVKISNKMVRTLFHQIVEGLSYMHDNRVCHLDLKLENILIGKDYKLKIADFDMAYQKGDILIQSAGSKNFRAPEILENECRLPESADIYSLGIILFCLKFGYLPYKESQKVKGINLFGLMLNDVKKFWVFHEKILGRTVSQKFKKLFESMVCKDPESRATLNEIRQSSWFLKPVYSQKEVEKEFSPKFQD